MKCFALAAGLLAANCGILRARSATISGVVFDSIHGVPLRHAVATPISSVSDTVFHSARSDETGKFVIPALHPGDFRLTVEQSFIDSTGIAVLPVSVSTQIGYTSAALALPSVATLRHIFCPAAVADTTPGVSSGRSKAHSSCMKG